MSTSVLRIGTAHIEAAAAEGISAESDRKDSVHFDILYNYYKACGKRCRSDIRSCGFKHWRELFVHR